jgi:G3E family GTPase
MADVTPVTVLTGWSGAGKTTLLNHLLRQPEFAGTAVLADGGAGTFPLPVRLNAGCLCCSLREELVRILRLWLPRARRDEIGRVVIETTGDADPAAIQETLARDIVTASAYRVDGIVTVVAATGGLTALAERQIAAADRIVVNKSDLADPGPLCARLHAINPHAAVITTSQGVVAAGFILAVR